MAGGEFQDAPDPLYVVGSIGVKGRDAIEGGSDSVVSIRGTHVLPSIQALQVHAVHRDEVGAGTTTLDFPSVWAGSPGEGCFSVRAPIVTKNSLKVGSPAEAVRRV